MTSGNVTSVSPNLMVNNQLSAKDGDKSGGFLDVMSKNVAKSDKKADTQNQVSGNDVKEDKAKVDKTKAQTPDDKKVTTKDNKADKDVNHFSDAKNAEATKDTSKADTANEATVVEEPAMEEAPVAMATMEEIPAEVIAIVDEALDNFASEVAKVLEEALNITEETAAAALPTVKMASEFGYGMMALNVIERLLAMLLVIFQSGMHVLLHGFARHRGTCDGIHLHLLGFLHLLAVPLLEQTLLHTREILGRFLVAQGLHFQHLAILDVYLQRRGAAIALNVGTKGGGVHHIGTVSLTGHHLVVAHFCG